MIIPWGLNKFAKALNTVEQYAVKNERGGSRKTNESRSKDSEIFELPHSSFVLEPDYADITKRL